MAFDHPLLVGAKVAVLVLGASVAGVSFFAWRRTGRRFMLYLAAAFALIALGSFAEGIAFEFLGWDLFAASALETLLVLGGLSLLTVLLRRREVQA
jgi:hypothetical protein